MFFIVLRQHVSILIESPSDPSKKLDAYLEMLKCAVGSQTLTFLIKLCIKRMCRCFIRSFIKNVNVWDPTAHSNFSK